MDDFLTQFSEAEAQTLLATLGCVLDHPDQYNNGVHFHSGDGVLQFSVERTNEPVTHRHERLTGDRVFLEKLVGAGLIRLVTSPARRVDKNGRRRGGEPNAYYFTQEAHERYRQRDTINDAAIRKAIGRYVFDHYRLHPAEFLDFDAEDVAQESKVAPKRVREQARLLRDVGLLNDVGPVNSAIEFGPLVLSKEGLRWAMRGFDDEPFTGLTVNVHVQINIRNFIQDLRQAPVAEELKHQAEDLVVEIQEEPSVEKVARLLGMAANAHQLAPAVIRFVSENGPALLQHLPGVTG